MKANGGGAGEEQRDDNDDHRRGERAVEQPRIEPDPPPRRSAETARPIGWSCWLLTSSAPIQRDASIGDSVSATKHDSSTAKARTKPNSAKSRPAVPGKNEIGMNTAARVAVVARHGEEDLAGAEHGGGARAEAETALARDVLDDDDGVIDDEAGGQHQGEQRQDVDREIRRARSPRGCRSARSAR